MTKAKSQRDEILRHLKQGHSVTAMDCLNKFGVMRAAARIHELRKNGHNIVSITETGNGGARYARYSLEDAA